jgi:hypothetical protein
MRNYLIYFRSDVLECVGGTQQTSSQLFPPLEKLIDFLVKFLGTIEDALTKYSL